MLQDFSYNKSNLFVEMIIVLLPSTSVHFSRWLAGIKIGLR
jgi:hypothetical protein